MKLLLPIDRHHTARVRTVLRALVRDLAALLQHPRYVEALGLAQAVASVMVSLQELDTALPNYEHDAVLEPATFALLRKLQACAVLPIHLPFDSASELIRLVLSHSHSLNGLLADVLRIVPRELQRMTSRCFDAVIGYLYTELMHPLYLQHPDLKQLVFGA